MTENFFDDNLDLQHHLDTLDLTQIVDTWESGYSNHPKYPAAPRNYADAKDNYRRILRLLGQICATRIAPRAGEADAEESHYHDGEVSYPLATQDALRLLRQAGLSGPQLPWEYGGLNLPGTIFQMMIEIISRADPGLMTIFGLQEISAVIAEYGDDEMKQSILPRFAREGATGAMVLTEPDAGSDLGTVQTRATYDEEAGVWRINGVKRFITNGNADISVVLARSEEGSDDARGLSLFLVEKDESVRIRRIEHKLGIRSSPTCEIQYNDTPAQLIGKRRFGLIRYAMGMMNGARLSVAAQSLGIAEAAYREARQYARQRIQFGQPIDTLPGVYRMLLSMRGEIEATRAMVYLTARLVDLGRAYQRRIEEAEKPDPADRKKAKQLNRLNDVLTPLVKYYASEMGNRVAYQAIQVHGGTGYMREFKVERYYRDMRVTSIYEGTSQLQVVAATGGLLGHTLGDLLEEWMGLDYPGELAPLKDQLENSTRLFNQCIDHLRGQEEPELINYYATDLVDAAAYVLNSWLLLQSAHTSERKQELSRVYLAETLPRLRGVLSSLQATSRAPLEARPAILSEPF
jgi:alkylation response protein AidB-like acyl-CoA dehydrogenase